MAENLEEKASLVRRDEQSGGREGAAASRCRHSHRLKLTTFVTLRKSLPVVITWDTKLTGFGYASANQDFSLGL